MKRLIYIIIGVLSCGLYASCEQKEIELYDQTPRVNFETRQRIREFVDTDYVKKTAFIVDSFTVRIQGDMLKEKRNFCVKATKNEQYENLIDVELEKSYTYTALDTVCQVFYYKIMCPQLKPGTRSYGCSLEFDLDNPLHQFDKGKVEQHVMPLNVRWQLTPNDWEDWRWQEYSDAKYKFMMDVCGCVYAEMDDAAYDKVVEAYKQYKQAGNPPIVDEKGKEITFE